MLGVNGIQIEHVTWAVSKLSIWVALQIVKFDAMLVGLVTGDPSRDANAISATASPQSVRGLCNLRDGLRQRWC